MPAGRQNRENRLNHAQKEAMLKFMEKHSQFAMGRIEAEQAHQVYNNLWKKLSEMLNGIEGGAIKNIQGWKDVWSRMRSKAKAVALANGKPKSTRTGGGYSSGEEENTSGPSPFTTDCEFTDRIMNLQGWHTVFGLGIKDELDSSSDENDNHTEQLLEQQQIVHHEQPVTAVSQIQDTIRELNEAVGRFIKASSKLQESSKKLTSNKIVS